MRMNPSTLFRPDLTSFEMKQRVALVEYGAEFHIRNARIGVTPAGQRKLGKFFEPANIQLAQITTLSDLTTAYSTWCQTAPESERARLRLRAGRGCMPAAIAPRPQLERRVLLTLAPHLDIEHVDIELTEQGRKNFAPACSREGLAVEDITTLAALVRTLTHVQGAVVAEGLQALKAKFGS